MTVVWDDPLIWGGRPEPAGYIYMLMVDRGFGGHGIGRSIFERAFPRALYEKRLREESISVPER